MLVYLNEICAFGKLRHLEEYIVPKETWKWAVYAHEEGQLQMYSMPLPNEQPRWYI